MKRANKNKLFFMSVYGGNLTPVSDLELTAKQFKTALKEARENYRATYGNDEELRQDNGAELETYTEKIGTFTRKTTRILEGCYWVYFEQYETEKDRVFNLKDNTPHDIKNYIDYEAIKNNISK